MHVAIGGVVGFLHLVVLYGYQGADREAEKLALTDQLLDAGELGWWPGGALDCWRFQRGAHQDPLPGKSCLGWALG